MNPIRCNPRPQTPRRQRGTMLIIALIILVAMTLAGIAMMRSVDTATVMAGNIAFKQASVNAVDQGIQAGFSYISTNSGGPSADVPSAGYYASATQAEPDWNSPVQWTGAALVNGGTADAAGNVVYYKIQRLCLAPGLASTSTCAFTTNTASVTATGSGVDQSAPNFFTLPPTYHYRVTARAVGPRNSIAIVQTMISF
jgi:type IV pilus assembly protein PilX